MIYIYGLYDPPERGGRLRYIGQAQNPKARWRDHWNCRYKKNPDSLKSKWLQSLDGPPPAEILAIVEDDEAFRTENAAIREISRRWPSLLLNSAINGNSPEWRATNSSRSAKMKAYYAANPEASRILSETARQNPSFGRAGAVSRWSDPAQHKAAREQGRPTFGAEMRDWWSRPENWDRMMARRGVGRWMDKPGTMSKPCRDCGVPVGVFSIDCPTCQKRKRHCTWTNRFGEWTKGAQNWFGS